MSSANARLWKAGGVVLVSLFAGKQLMWNQISDQVSTIRKEEHSKAVAVLKDTQSNALKYDLKPLTSKQLAKLESDKKK
jgi:hypothetical protein